MIDIRKRLRGLRAGLVYLGPNNYRYTLDDTVGTRVRHLLESSRAVVVQSYRLQFEGLYARQTLWQLKQAGGSVDRMADWMRQLGKDSLSVTTYATPVVQAVTRKIEVEQWT